MKKKVIILVITLLFLTTGCTQSMKDKESGENFTSNVLCRPSAGSTMEEYYERNSKKVATKLEDLPACNKFKANSGGYTGIWESVFVKPLAYVILAIGNLVGNFGLSVIIVGLLIRLVMLPISLKTSRQSEVMKKVQPEIAKIEKKYKDKKDSASMMAKSQETMTLYKKHKISPLSGCITAFIQLPLFIAFLEAVNRVPAIFEGNFLGLNLGTTAWAGLFGNGQYLYIVVIALIIVTTYFAFKNMGTPNKDANGMGNQMQFMNKFMIIFMSVISLSLPTAIALYWTVTNCFTIGQNLFVKRSMKK